MTRLGAHAESLLESAGIDLCADLPYRGRAAVLLASTRALWAPFVAWLRALPARAEVPNPLDTYVAERVAELLPGREVVWPWAEGAPGFVALAVQAGLLWRGPGGLGIHRRYGPWVGLRGLVLLDEPPAAREVAPAPACLLCATCCAPAWAALPAPESEASFRREWRAWASARASCPLGADHRYGDDQLAYHYTHDRDILRRIARDGAAA